MFTDKVKTEQLLDAKFFQCSMSEGRERQRERERERERES